MDQTTILAVLIGAIITGGISYLFNKKSKQDDDDKALEKRVTALEVAQRDVAHMKTTQDSMLRDVREVITSLANLRIEIASKRHIGIEDE
jgi:hypothetical protein